MPVLPGMRWKSGCDWVPARMAKSGCWICIPCPTPALTASMDPPPWACPDTSPSRCIPEAWKLSVSAMTWFTPICRLPVLTGATVQPRVFSPWKLPSTSWQSSWAWTPRFCGTGTWSKRAWSCLPIMEKPPMPAPWTGVWPTAGICSAGRKSTPSGIWATGRFAVPV